MPHVALYCRLSPRPDGSYEGVDLQEGWGREYAAKVWPDLPIEVFADRGISAANGDHRPEYERLREWIADGRAAHVWCVEQYRIERREIGWFELAAELDAAGITELHTNRDGVVRVHDDVAGIKAVLGAGEVRRIKRRVRDVLAAKKALGAPPAAPTFGYRHGVDEAGKKTLHLHPKEAPAVQTAAVRILTGWSQTNVVRELTKDGFTGRFGGPLTPGKIKKILTNPTVAGFRVQDGQKIKGVWTPILDEETWRAVRRKLEAPRIVLRSDGKTHPIGPTGLSPRNGRKYLLTGGLAVCGICEAPMAGTRRQDHRAGSRHVVRQYMLCSPARGGCGRVSILLEPMEEYVTEALLAALDTEAFRAAVTEDEHTAERAAATAELEDVERDRIDIAEDRARGRMRREAWAASERILDEREATARQRLAVVPPPLAGVDVDAVREAWPEMTLDERRAMLRLFIDRVIVAPAKPGARYDETRISITWAVS